MPEYAFDWAELAFGNKKELKNLQAIFIAAPRELSAKRFKALLLRYLPQGNIVLGLAKEEYVLGLEGQPQFKTLKAEAVRSIIERTNAAPLPHKVYTLSYSQQDMVFVLEKSGFKKVLLINGSWYHAFHYKPEYYTLAQKQIPYEMLSPFADEQEAMDYAAGVKLDALPQNGSFTELEMLQLASRAATHSFDYGGFQTAVSLGRKKGRVYELLATAHNKVVPYETYAMHYGASREKHFSPQQDLNHYDTIHAEVALLIKVATQKISLAGTTLFINLLPCPACARMFTETPIAEFVYTEDHSAGYAVGMLEKAGKTVRRIVPAQAAV
jgi:deoxycytidylate deaminase